MKIAVLGSTGMAGHVVALYLEENGYEVYRTSRSEQNTINRAAIDATDFNKLSKWLEAIQPDVVVNCIGLLQKACEQRTDLAVSINSYLPHWLEQCYIHKSTKIIHLSTDCVFSGNDGGYCENALPDGRTMYDRSKSLGEIINSKDLTFRMSIIGPDIDKAGTGLFNWFMQQHKEIQGYSRTIWNGVTTVELARAIDAAIKQDITGLYHLVQPEPIDKCSLLILFKNEFKRETVSIEPVDGPKVNKSLINTRVDFDFVVKSYEGQIKDLRKWTEKHKELYPHYFQS